MFKQDADNILALLHKFNKVADNIIARLGVIDRACKEETAHKPS
jgi:hypothetical protein